MSHCLSEVSGYLGRVCVCSFCSRTEKGPSLQLCALLGTALAKPSAPEIKDEEVCDTFLQVVVVEVYRFITIDSPF